MRDRQIVELYWERREEAIHQTERKYGAYLSKVAYNILGDFEDSQECVNDTYLAAWNSIPPNRPGSLLTYLSKITRQISIDVFRKRHAVKRYPSEYALCLEELGDSFTDGVTPEQALEAKLLDDAINRFVRALPADARKAFVGRYYFFDPLRDIAAYCGMTESGVKSLLYRTRQRLKAYLAKEGYDL
ncbi:MAG: sigma-70 family RNA polymerase sigma factor [Oscillospiraceae bacterium]|nr:sigma-70 family RNA polymerase sigma factor [Oscillospiraceae bacterium]